MAAVAGAIGDLTTASHHATDEANGEATDNGVSTVTATVPVNLRPLLAVMSGNIPDPDAPFATQVVL
jgi:hypothetical protein